MSHEDLIKEMRPVGKYRVRILHSKGGPILDIREYINDETFQGFTRRGIRLASRAELYLLRDILDQITVEEWGPAEKASAQEEKREKPNLETSV